MIGPQLTMALRFKALCLQLRLSPLVDELALYDRTKAPGVAVDLSHIPSKQVSGSTLVSTYILNVSY